MGIAVQHRNTISCLDPSSSSSILSTLNGSNSPCSSSYLEMLQNHLHAKCVLFQQHLQCHTVEIPQCSVWSPIQAYFRITYFHGSRAAEQSSVPRETHYGSQGSMLLNLGPIIAPFQGPKALKQKHAHRSISKVSSAQTFPNSSGLQGTITSRLLWLPQNG